jgi:predicted aconitase
LLGKQAGERVPAIVGLPPASEDDLKALGAAAASSGAAALFHVVGQTPEAPDLKTATGGRQVEVVGIDPDDLQSARRQLSTTTTRAIDGVALGTPHASAAELRRIVELIGQDTPLLPIYVNTGREALMTSGVGDELTSAGVIVVTDTCTYLTPIMDPRLRTVMTDSAKWAYYAPGNLGLEVVFGSMEECVRSALAGEVRFE